MYNKSLYLENLLVYVVVFTPHEMVAQVRQEVAGEHPVEAMKERVHSDLQMK